jgi:hypothetical protein
MSSGEPGSRWVRWASWAVGLMIVLGTMACLGLLFAGRITWKPGTERAPIDLDPEAMTADLAILEPEVVPPLASPAWEQDAKQIRLIPEGVVFRRVSPARYGRPQPDFFLLETEVTNLAFAQYLAATGNSKDDQITLTRMQQAMKRASAATEEPVYWIRNRSLLWPGNGPPSGNGDYPVALLDVHQAAAFCEWLTGRYAKLGVFRLPTVAEWLVAAYGDGRNYPWGDAWDGDRACCSAEARRTAPEPVRARPAGRTPEGIYGMWGNVSELVMPPDGAGAHSLGGSFADVQFTMRQQQWGHWQNPGSRAEDVGFRVLLNVTHNEVEKK